MSSKDPNDVRTAGAKAAGLVADFLRYAGPPILWIAAIAIFAIRECQIWSK